MKFVVLFSILFMAHSASASEARYGNVPYLVAMAVSSKLMHKMISLEFAGQEGIGKPTMEYRCLEKKADSDYFNTNPFKFICDVEARVDGSVRTLRVAPKSVDLCVSRNPCDVTLDILEYTENKLPVDLDQKEVEMPYVPEDYDRLWFP